MIRNIQEQEQQSNGVEAEGPSNVATGRVRGPQKGKAADESGKGVVIDVVLREPPGDAPQASCSGLDEAAENKALPCRGSSGAGPSICSWGLVLNTTAPFAICPGDPLARGDGGPCGDCLPRFGSRGQSQ